MRSIWDCGKYYRRCFKYENDISTEEASESKGSRLQSKNGYKIGKKGSCRKKSKG